MTSEHPRTSRWSLLLHRRDWVYLLSLLIPFALYDLVLKSVLIFSVPNDPGIAEALGLMQIRLPAAKLPTVAEAFGLMQSNLWFDLGYVSLWIGAFALARTRISRWITFAVCHLATICVALITTIAYQYFRATGSTLDFDTLFLGLASLEDIRSLVASEVSASIVALVVVMLGYALVGPALITSLIDRFWARLDTDYVSAGSGWRRSVSVLGLVLAAYVLFSLSLLPSVGSTGMSRSFARDAFLNVMVSAADVVQADESDPVVSDFPALHLPTQARLIPTAATKHRNVVLIFLESTRAAATTPYNKQLLTTPFMDQLAKTSLLVEKAYAIIPHTHKALTATNCGIYPPLDDWETNLLALPDTLPDICLPHLLRAQGYNTAYFMSHTASFENSQQILENMGYNDFFSIEDMDTSGFEPTNYFGYEDEIMLKPSETWLQGHRDQPFLASYLTSAPHHDYLAPQKRHGRVAFTDNDVVNRYLNSVRNQDFFLKQLFEQYQRLGLYDNTIFVLLGDHGQGFGEHGRNAHDNNIYEEGLRIPLLIHDPQRFKRGTRIAGPISQLDILPTVADLLGYTLQGDGYSGRSILQPRRTPRTLMFSCSGDKGCMASLTGTQKYIHHFDDRPAELFDLASDPAERINLAGERSPQEIDRRRAELLAWRNNIHSMYTTQPAK